MAKQLRIAGLVRAADMVRRELSAPITAAQRETLRKRVEKNVQAVQRILQEERGQVADLPAPSQRAYLFLANLDWSKLGMPESPPGATAGMSQPTAPRGPMVTWPGLGGVLERMTEVLADDVSDETLQRISESIGRSSRQIESIIARKSYSPDRFSPETRGRRGWVAYFSRLENLMAYRQARRCANRVLDVAAKGSRHYPPPLAIHFRPLRGIYKLRAARTGPILWLPTPMILFDEAGFAAIASLIYERASVARQNVIELMTGDGYQSVLAELESLGGVVEQSRGAIHDLANSFDRVNADYFRGTMIRPHLTWNRTFTGRKFGHYDFVHDTLMVSRTLDAAEVPPFVVDFLVFHELLHKFHGLHWVNGRGYAHTSEFQRDERKFARYDEAEAVLKKLALSVR